MRIARPVRLIAASALSAVVATTTAGALATPAVAAPGKPAATPAPTLTTYPANPTSSTTADFAWTAPVTETYTCTLDGVAGGACLSPVSYPGLANGSHTFSLKAKLATGKSKPSTVSYSWVVDTAPPQVPTVQQVPSPTKNTSANVFFTDADPGAVSFTCAVDDADPAAAVSCSSPYNVVVADGQHTAYVYAFDALNNRSSAGVMTWSVDTNAPASPVFTQVPANPTTDTSATFAWTDGDATSFTCAIDGGVPAACSSGDTFTGLTEGGHTLSVQGQDTAGNVGSPALFGWAIDLSAPEVPQIVTGPANPTDQASALFLFTDTDPSATFLCKLDDGAFDSCTSPLNFASLLEGDHQLQVKAVDAVGNESAAAVYQWTIDLSDLVIVVSPVVFLTGPGAYSNDATPSFTWSPLDANTTGYECSVDLGAYAACGTATDAGGNPTETLDVSGEGQHVFAVRALNGTSTSPATAWTWHFDTTPPTQPAFSTTPATIDGSANALFSFASDADTQFACALDGADAVLCASPVTFFALAPGEHTFVVTATDAAGNTSQSSFTWTIDPGAPLAPLMSGPSGLVNTADAEVSWTQVDPSVTDETCTLDGQPQTCSSPVTLQGLAEGSHVFQVTASNGGASSSQSAVSWTVDTTKPVLDVAGVPSGATNVAGVNPVITQTEAHPGPTVCALAGPTGTVDNCGPYGLVDGDYTLTVNTTDQAGNAADPVVLTWTVDRTPPGAPTVTGPSGIVNSADASFTYGPDSDVASYDCSLDGGAAATCADSYPGLGEGAHTLDVTASDALGNTSAATHLSWVVDTMVPSVATTRVPTQLRGGALVTYSEDVTGLVAGAVSLTLTDSHAVVATRSTCRTAAGASVDCAGTTPYRSVRLTPTRALVPGQHYTLASAAGAVQDAATNTSTAGTRSFRGRRVLQENTLPVAAAWQKVGSRRAYGKSYVREHFKAAQVSWTFTGRSVTWLTVTGPTQGKALVLVDGHSRRTVNNYATATHFKVARAFSRLGAGRHVITVRALGLKGAKAGKGTYVAVDGFTVGTKRTVSPKLTATWRRVAGTGFYSGHATVANLRGEAVSLRFRGTSVAWYTLRNRYQGKAQVFVDGVRKATVDNYSTTTRYHARRLVRGLADTVHTIRIVALGKHHRGARGNTVTVDRFAIG